MPLRNTHEDYGWIAIALHWGTALAILALFPLGLWMVDLGYYHAWYQRAPALHVSVGMIVAGLLAVRVLWRLANPAPALEPGMPAWERLAARGAHLAMYVLMLTVVVSGYLVTTADGKPVAVFGLLGIPALPWAFERQEDFAGIVHRWAAWALVATAAVHTAAALKHHVLDRDRTLMRMLRPGIHRSVPFTEKEERR